MNDFETWWYHEGSAPPLPGEDSEEHCKRMCKIAWSNGGFKLLDALKIARREAIGWYDDSQGFDPKNPPDWLVQIDAEISKAMVES
jgi:hypothetical protein